MGSFLFLLRSRKWRGSRTELFTGLSKSWKHCGFKILKHVRILHYLSTAHLCCKFAIKIEEEHRPFTLHSLRKVTLFILI